LLFGPFILNGCFVSDRNQTVSLCPPYLLCDSILLSVWSEWDPALVACIWQINLHFTGYFLNTAFTPVRVLVGVTALMFGIVLN